VNALRHSCAALSWRNVYRPNLSGMRVPDLKLPLLCPVAICAAVGTLDWIHQARPQYIKLATSWDVVRLLILPRFIEP